MDYTTTGLLGGLANGIKEGLLTYQTQKNIQHSQQMQELLNGYQKDENGNLAPTPMKQAEQRAGLLKNQELIGSHDPNDPMAQRLATARGTLLHAANNNLSPDMFKGQSEYEQEKLEALSKPEISGSYGMLGKSAMADIMGQRVGVQKDNQVISAGHSFESDPILKQTTTTKNNLDRALKMLDGKTPITSQNFAILQQDMINAMAPGGAATEGKVNREMVTTLQSKLNELASKFGDVQDLRAAQPQIVQQLRDTIKGVRGDYGAAANQRIKEIGSNFDDVKNKDVKNTVNRKMGLLSDKFSADEDSGSNVGQDPKIVQYAKQFTNGDYAHAEQILRARGYGK